MAPTLPVRIGDQDAEALLDLRTCTLGWVMVPGFCSLKVRCLLDTSILTKCQYLTSWERDLVYETVEFDLTAIQHN